MLKLFIVCCSVWERRAGIFKWIYSVVENLWCKEKMNFPTFFFYFSTIAQLHHVLIIGLPFRASHFVWRWEREKKITIPNIYTIAVWWCCCSELYAAASMWKFHFLSLVYSRLGAFGIQHNPENFQLNVELSLPLPSSSPDYELSINTRTRRSFLAECLPVEIYSNVGDRWKIKIISTCRSLQPARIEQIGSNCRRWNLM